MVFSFFASRVGQDAQNGCQQDFFRSLRMALPASPPLPYLPASIADAAPNKTLAFPTGVGANGRSLGSFALTATGDLGIGYPFLGSGGPRGMQLAVKFTF